ncbi:septal ring lytic transglycosylase RlpA family protein [Chamaesiphon sp. VAR_48_metabat_135_sub]|uniref:septal ring lytic transglycosylase RlpA family protein n=1 Tax=Chamaesiphon sp. VAR_48_metabat_135_sub TaxID=2964699 RepID=UPI0037C0A423
MKSVDNYSPLSPQSLPTITPLVVTELETDAAIPAVIHPVPQVSKLPIVTKLAVNTKPQATLKQHRATKTGSIPKNIQTQFPLIEQPLATALFNPHSQVKKAILSVPNQVDSSPEIVNSVIPLPSPIATQVIKSQPTAFTPFITKTASAPIPVVRDPAIAAPVENRSQLSRGEIIPPTVINNSATIQAEIANVPPTANLPGQIIPSGDPSAVISTAIDRTEPNAASQAAPLVSNPNKTHSEGLRQRSDLPSFEAGLPVFVFDNERPQQIVATAIAQVGDTIVAPEPSIAIPVERPKQLTIPSQLPVTSAPVAPAVRSIPTVTTVPTTPAVRSIPTVTAVPSVPPLKPNGTGIVKIEQPSETVRPALDKIVATQSGQASWYGSEGGSRTANGERYYPEGLTAAHRTLPFGTKVRVTSLKTGKTVTVRINDRGPFHGRRIIDVSAGAARVIGLKSAGVGAVRMDILANEKSGQEE